MTQILEARPRVLTVEEVAERLRLDSGTVYDLIRRRELHARKVGHPAGALQIFKLAGQFLGQN